MTTRIEHFAVVPLAIAGLSLAACGSGGSGSEPQGAEPAPTATTTNATPGVWKGTINSTATGQAASVVALTGDDGHTAWMTTDGRVWAGQLPLHGDGFEVTLAGHMLEGAHFPDGTNHGPAVIDVDHHSTSDSHGRYSGSGDAGTFAMAMSMMWNRSATLDAVAGVYTRTTSSGYTMTMTIDAHGQMTGSDSSGCVFSGVVTVPSAMHNLYDVEADVTSCGTLDGHYSGMGTLLDADAMQDWMATMHSFDHGGHSHGGPMMGGGHDMGHNTVPSGRDNLFMFAMFNDHDAIMDALAR